MGHLSPIELVWALMDSQGIRNAERFPSKLDRTVLSTRWRLWTMIIFEHCSFAVVVLLCAVAGAAAFFSKLCQLSVLLQEPDQSFWQQAWTLSTSIVFLNQAMSIISARELLMERVTTFVFGGRDALVSSEEHFIISAYLAALAGKIWTSS